MCPPLAFTVHFSGFFRVGQLLSSVSIMTRPAGFAHRQRNALPNFFDQASSRVRWVQTNALVYEGELRASVMLLRGQLRAGPSLFVQSLWTESALNLCTASETTYRQEFRCRSQCARKLA